MMQHYSAKDYKAGISNWDMLQTDDGLLYFANLHGILRFDGQEWEFIEIEGGKFARSIHKDPSGRIFVGSNDEFGYLDMDSLNNLVYKSLSKRIELEKFGIVMQILSTKDHVFFITQKYLVQYGHESKDFKHWKLNRGFGGFVHNENLYIKEINKPLTKLSNNQLIPISTNLSQKPALIRSNIIDGIKQGEKYIIGTNENHGYIFRNDSILKTLHQYQLGKSIISLSQSDSSGHSVWASTSNNGIFNLAIGDSIVHQINTKMGLPTNINFNIYSDNQNGVWALHQEGITRIDGQKNIMSWSKDQNLNATISSIRSVNDQIYLSTVGGLYSFNSEKKLYLIDNSKDRLFNVFSVNDFVFALGDKGLYKFRDAKLQSINPISEGSNAFISEENKLYVTTSSKGIVQYSIDSDKSQEYIPEISGFCNSILSLGSKHWLSYKSDGIYLIQENGGIPKWTFFNQKHGLPDVNEINILKSLDNKTLFTTSQGFYTLNNNPQPDSSNLFIPYTKITDEKLNITNIDVDANGNYWLTITEESKRQVVLKFERNQDDSYQKIKRSLTGIPDQNFTSIYVDDTEEGVVWIAGNEGLYRFDEKVEVNLDINFNTFIKKVSLKDSVITHGLHKTYNKSDSIPTLSIVQDTEAVPRFNFTNNSIKFKFAALFYEQPERNQYSYYLKGFDKAWSGWSNLTSKEYTNLPAGKYEFKVKSKNLYNTEGSAAIYRFEILPPWYQTMWAYFAFSIIIVTVIWLLMLAYTYRVRQHRKRLKLIVADRTFEVIQQKKVIEKQLLKLSNLNEEISQQRDDILEKNQELESSQEEIIAVNNKLHELNHALEARVEKRTAKIKDTIRKLQQTNKDLDTFTYKTSHDLKGPISRIKGILALARFENPNTKSDKYLNLIEKTTKEMDVLLEKLTQVHNIYNSKIERNAIAIPSQFKAAMEKISPLLDSSKFKFHFDLKNENDLKTDKKMLELILLNLLENALTYYDSQKSTHVIKLSTVRKKDVFYIMIEDNGLGIAENQLPKIFEMFYRGSEKSIGNGLGLYLVKVAVEKIGGKLTCESEVNEFTRFTLTFPLN